MTLMEIIENNISEIKQVINYAEKVLRAAPEGSLRTKHSKAGTMYYRREKGETTGCYLGKKCNKQIRQLEEKLYYTELLKAAKQEEQELIKFQKKLKKLPDYQSVFLNMPRDKRHLISPYEQKPQKNDDDLIRAFNKKFVSEEIKLISQNGEHVRSKSELIIADRLKAAGVSYFYEDPLVLSEENKMECLLWHPDFRVQNIRTGKVYYWEHFGMMDNCEYCKTSQERLEIYAHYGYFPGDNLIITTESSQHGLNTEYVDCLISKYLM